jgi:hypothetical protein
MSLTNNIYLSLFPGSVLSGISVYFILSYLFVPNTFTVPAAIIVSILAFGLSRYHTLNNGAQYREQNIFRNAGHENNINSNINLPFSVFHIVFVIVYLFTLIISGFFSNTNQDLFVPWNQFTATQILQLASSILLCFFLPGYIIVDVLDNKKHELQPILKVLLAYIFSIAIVGFGGYISASLGYHTSEIKPVLLCIYAALLIIFIVTKSTSGLLIHNTNYFQRLKILIYLNTSEILVFASLFALIILSTYSLYQGVIIGDQWFHHGRTLSFLGGVDRAEVDDTFYSSFFHGILASFISLSGVPSVNAYSSISFLNIIPVFAFYYFFNKWVPSRNPNWPKAALLACVFFILSSGFGWINMMTMSVSTNPVKSPLSSAELFQLVETRTLDIQRAGSFIITSSPQFGTSLTLFALPLGFVLLGLVKEKVTPRIKYVTILGTTTTVGVLSHDEFYLFIIVGCLLPLIFKLSERKNSIYLTMLCSMLLVAIVDIASTIQLSTVQYYTARNVLGIPLIVLIALIVGLAWLLYASRIINRLHANAYIRQKSVRKFFGGRHQLKSSVLIAMVAVIAYLYIFTFLVWGQLSSVDIHLQQDPYDLPWYLYPMKLGVTGLLGISFILSYLFRKFEMEIFVFGLIAVVALLLGPYYDEYRLSKYIMVAMGAFASIFITRIILSIHSSHIKLIVGLVIGFIVTSSSLSTLMFTGYVASALQNPDFEEFSIVLRNKIFPTPQEVNFLNYLHKNINFKKDHLVFPLEYGGPDSKLESFKDQKLANKIQAFVGTPLISPPKIFNSPFTLNASTIAGLYYLLNSTNINYMILPKENIINHNLQQPVQFALDNFPKAYEDSNYIVLTVPSIVAPISSVNSVALINQQEGMFLSSLVSDEKLLRFNNNSKTLMPSESVKTPIKENETLKIFNGDKRSTIWSNSLQQKDVNYIEGKFRVVGQNDSTVGSSGIVWRNGIGEYDVSLKDRGLQILEKDSKFNKEVLLSENADVKKERSTWYTLKVLTLGNTIAIYLDDVLKLQVRTAPFHNPDITKVGITVDQNNAEFEPIMVGHISQSQSSNMSYNRGIYYQFFYPLSELALSKTAYNTFVDGDKSAFSHKTIMLPWDPSYNDTNFKDYLQFVNDGGRFVVINARDSFIGGGGFSKLLNLTTGNTTKFDRIEGPGDEASNAIAVSGSARTIDLKNSNATAISYYMNDGKKVAPFALESKFGSAGGQIIFVNSNGYYDALFKSPERFFMTLGHIPSILGLNFANYTNEVLPDNVTTGARFVGDLRISGPAHTIITSPSLLIPNVNPYTVDDISTSNSSIPINGIDKKNNLKNGLLENLTFSGSYRATIESTGVVSLPSSVYQYDYIGVSLPKRVDLTLKLLDKSGKAEFIVTGSNATGKYRVPVSISNIEEIRFHNMGLQDISTDNQTIIMKSPEINATGNITVNNLYTPARGESDINLKQLNASVHHSDNYIINYKNASRMQFVTYLNWIQTKGISEDKQIAIKLPLPGDISERAKKKGVGVPWEEVMVSTNGVILLLSVVSVTAIAIWRSERLGPNMK